MESKHPIGDKKEAQSVNEKTLTEVSSHLGDIELKIDHLIESIHDSLYRLKNNNAGRREEFP